MLRRIGRDALRTAVLGGLLTNRPLANEPKVLEPLQPRAAASSGDQVVAVSTPTKNSVEGSVEKEKVPGSLTVFIRIENNVRNAHGAVIGMTGQESLEYFSLAGQTYTETQRVNWTEDGKKDNSTLAYEYPAAPADFSLSQSPAEWHTKYRLVSDHPEGGITLHGLGKHAHSEGCILASDPFRRRIEHEAASGPIHVEILPIVDERSAQEIAAAPLPYSDPRPEQTAK